MTDGWNPTGDDESVSDDEHVSDAATPPPPPTAPTAGVDPVITLESEGEVRSSRGLGGRALAGIVGALLLVGGTVFALTQIGSSGAGSPEEAVSDLLDAASNEDVLGLLAALDPGERDALRQPIQDMFAELERLEVLDPSFALDGIAGVDLEFEGVTYRTEPVRDDLVRVYFTGGTVTGSFDSDELPIGDFVSDTLARFEADISGIEETETTEIADDDTFLVARDGTDGWRVSIGYTAAESARLDAGLPLPASGIEPIGADSPEAAVEGLIRATADLDLRGIIARLSPGELGALQEYAGLFIDDAAREMASAGDEFDLTIDDLTLKSDQSGDRASVYIETFAVSMTVEGDTISVSTDGECFTIDGDLDALELEDSPFGDGPICASDLEEFSSGFFDQFGFGGGDDDDLGLGGLPDLSTPTVGITTAKVDGQWFVAPVSTGLDGMVAVLEVLDRETLDAIVDLVERFITGLGEGFSSSFDSGFEGGFEENFGGSFGEEGILQPDFEESFGGGGGTAPPVDEAALEEFVRSFAGNEATAACILSELRFADEYVRFELADAYTYEYEPGQETQEVFFASVAACSQG